RHQPANRNANASANEKAVEEVLSNAVYRTNVQKLNDEFKVYHPNELCEHYAAQLVANRNTVTSKAKQQPEPIY
ncbi:MAG: hypothetical protein C4329_03925, partial [Chitinophagaceae bacterium]